MSNILRHYRRDIAHLLMKEAGCKKVNKGNFFALNWREYKVALKNRRKKKEVA